MLKLIRFNTIFESKEVKDDKTGLLSLVKVKKIAAYHQFYVVKKVLMRYGWPPDVARLEADRVLEQSELLANEISA